MQSQPPIFIVGESRTGKSLLGNLLAVHPDTCWFSNYSNKFYRLPIFSFLNRILDAPILGNILKKKIVSGERISPFPQPNEGDHIYHLYCKLENKRWVTEKDLSDRQTYLLKGVIKKHLAYSGKPRFINDESANVQRIRQIAAIFPDAFFIHVIRDGRAVSNEIFQTPWWQQRKIWWYGPNPGSYRKEGPEPILLCGLGWKYSIESIRSNKDMFKNNYLEVRYEELTANPREVVSQVRAHCGLAKCANFNRYIPEKLTNNNYRWPQELTQRQIDTLNDHLGDFLKSLNY